MTKTGIFLRALLVAILVWMVSVLTGAIMLGATIATSDVPDYGNNLEADAFGTIWFFLMALVFGATFLLPTIPVTLALLAGAVRFFRNAAQAFRISILSFGYILFTTAALLLFPNIRSLIGEQPGHFSLFILIALVLGSMPYFIFRKRFYAAFLLHFGLSLGSLYFVYISTAPHVLMEGWTPPWYFFLYQSAGTLSLLLFSRLLKLI